MMETRIIFEAPIEDGDALRPTVNCNSMGLYGFPDAPMVEIWFDRVPERQRLAVDAAPEAYQALYRTFVEATLALSRGEWTEKANSTRARQIAEERAAARAAAEAAERAAAEQPGNGGGARQ